MQKPKNKKKKGVEGKQILSWLVGQKLENGSQVSQKVKEPI